MTRPAAVSYPQDRGKKYPQKVPDTFFPELTIPRPTHHGTDAAMIRLLVLATLLFGFATTASSAEIVRYHCKDWKAKHIHDEKKAETIAGTLKKLGCEVKQNSHNGHHDVKYRCPKWRELSLKTHAEASKWEKWLKEYGFETEHRH